MIAFRNSGSGHAGTFLVITLACFAFSASAQTPGSPSPVVTPETDAAEAGAQERPDDAAPSPEKAPEATAPPANILPGPTIPRAETPRAETPRAETTAPPAGEETAGAERAPLAPPVEGIEVGKLSVIDPSSIGLMQAEDGGFPWETWQGSDAALVRQLMRHLPVPFDPPVLQDLARRLLLSAAAVPAEAEENQGTGETESLLALRVDRLAAAGQLDSVNRLLERTAPYLTTDALQRRRVEALLLSEEISPACDIAEAAVRRSDAAYWLKLAAYCRALDGDTDGAARALDILGETAEPDADFVRLLSRLMAEETGQLPEGMALNDPSPLIFSLVRSLKVELPVEVLLTADPLVLRAIATASNASLPVRLEAAEQAAAIGALPLDRLAATYEEVQFEEAEKARALTLVQGDMGARGHALLYQMALEASDAASRLQYLQTAWDLARQQGQYPLIARINLPAARSIEPASAHMAQAADVVRALLMGGAVDRAYDWYRVIRQAASAENIDATSVLLAVWPLMQFAHTTEDIPYSDRILNLWWQAQLTQTREERTRRGRLMLGLLEALDYAVPDSLWRPLIADPIRVNDPAPALSVWRTLLRAGQGERLGEMVLAALDGLGGRGLENASLAAISSIIGQFRALGLQEEAHRLALETAILRGL